MVLIKDRNYFKEQKDKLKEIYEENSNFSGMREFFVRKGESARFWFMEDYENLPGAFVHNLTRQTKTGRDFYPTVYCERTSVEDDDSVCKYCSDGENYSIVAVAPVWVDIIGHVEPDKDGKWEARRNSSGDPVYVENVEQIRLFVIKNYMDENLKTILYGDGLDGDGEETSLTAQPFTLTKSDGKKSQNVIVKRNGDSAPAEAVKAYEAIDLEEEIDKFFTRFSDNNSKRSTSNGNSRDDRADAPFEEFEKPKKADVSEDPSLDI